MQKDYLQANWMKLSAQNHTSVTGYVIIIIYQLISKIVINMQIVVTYVMVLELTGLKNEKTSELEHVVLIHMLP